MSSNLYQLKDIVIDILNAEPETRESDMYLYLKVVEQLAPECIDMSFKQALLSGKLPSTESVRRARQKAMEQFPGLKASDQVQGYRKVEEHKFFSFAIDKVR